MTLKTSMTAVAALVLTVSVLAGSPAAAVDRDRPAPTRTTLTVTPTSGPAHQPVTATVVVTSGARVRDGAVTIRDGSTVLVAGLALDRGTASITTNTLGPGPHVLTAELAGTAKLAGSRSDAVNASYGDDAGGSGTFNVVLTIPSGALTITSPYSATRPLDLGRADVDQSTSTFASGARIDDIVITDTRAGNQGFTASVSSSRFVSPDGGSFPATRAGFVDVVADQVPGNALRARDVRVVDTRPGSPGLGSPRVFARYPAGVSIGTVHVHGTLAVTGVPSSVRAGRYLATLTFTAV